jgi:hypothetical protein
MKKLLIFLKLKMDLLNHAVVKKAIERMDCTVAVCIGYGKQ